jgi:hypothetical protein
VSLFLELVACVILAAVCWLGGIAWERAGARGEALAVLDAELDNDAAWTAEFGVVPELEPLSGPPLVVLEPLPAPLALAGPPDRARLPEPAPEPGEWSSTEPDECLPTAGELHAEADYKLFWGALAVQRDAAYARLHEDIFATGAMTAVTA